VAIVLSAALGLAAFVGLRRRWRSPLAAVLLLLFVILVRPEPSVVRAAAMGAVGLVGLSTSRRRAGIPALSLAVLTLLVWDPWLARSAGFSLSTLATLGLLLFAGPWGAAIGRLLPARIRSWGPALAVPVAAQLMCAPVIVLLQSSVSLVGVVANLFAAPFVAPATVLGVATALVSVVSTTVAGWIGWLAAGPTLVIALIARTAAGAPAARVPWPGTGVGAAVLALLGLVLVVTAPWLAQQARRRPLLPVGAALLGIGAAAPTQLVTWPLTGWGFVACDVGQGDGLVLATGVGRAVVVDAGPTPRASTPACAGYRSTSSRPSSSRTSTLTTSTDCPASCAGEQCARSSPRRCETRRTSGRRCRSGPPQPASRSDCLRGRRPRVARAHGPRLVAGPRHPRRFRSQQRIRRAHCRRRRSEAAAPR
jgi:competence protein ComEC